MEMHLPTTLLLEGGRAAGEALMNLSGTFPNPKSLPVGGPLWHCPSPLPTPVTPVKSVCEQMWRTQLPVRIQPRLHEACLGIGIDAMLSWSPKEAKVRNTFQSPVTVRGKVNYWPRIFYIPYFHWHSFSSIRENPELELEVKINPRW